MYFLTEGRAGYVLPRYNNFKYIDFNKGCFFGVVDIPGSCLRIQKKPDLQYCLENWYKLKDEMLRQFTVGTQSLVELLTLSLEDLYRMSFTYHVDYERLMKDSFDRLERIRKLSVIASDFCHKRVMAHTHYC